MHNRSPLRYPGGKTRACKILDKIVDEYFDIARCDNLVSPFFGGGSFEFYIQNKYNLLISANDKFTPLWSFWTSCKLDKQILCDALYAKIGTVEKSNFIDYRAQIVNESDRLRQGVMYFIINRCSFSGATLSGGFSKVASKRRFTISSIDRINKLNLSKFKIHNLDFAEFMTSSVNERSLLFIDPPYFLGSGSNLYGTKGDLHKNFDHERLKNCLDSQKNWILTYNDCSYIRDLYSDYRIIDASWSYSMNKSKSSSEIIIINPAEF